MLLDPRINKYFQGRKVFVDLGCGSGEILDQLVERFDCLVGLDGFLTRFKKRNEKPKEWNFLQANLNQPFPLKSNCAETVLANQSIEHIIDPSFFALEIYRILQTEGVSIITTPNIRYLKNLWRIVVKGRGPSTASGNQIDGPWDGGHIHYFTHRDLREIFAKVGFSTVLSQGLVDLRYENLVRRLADLYSTSTLVREFFCGNILLIAKK